MEKGSCHCGAVQIEAEIQSKDGMSCNCSICRRKGTILTFVPEQKFKLISGREVLTDYQFGKKSIHHLFCKVCGVTCFAEGKAPNGDHVYAVNYRCLDSFDMASMKISEFDGSKI